MKTKLLITILCACALCKVQSQEWEFVCSLTNEHLRSVCTQGSDTVYVVGEKGLIAKSTDKGLTWEKKYFSNQESLNDIIFHNHEIGFIAGNNGTILKTRDAGSSWEQINSGTVHNINAIAAFDLNNIWAVGDEGIIIYSSDRGETWSSKSLLLINRNLKTINNKGNIGFITGEGATLLKTEDGGTTWEEQILSGYYDWSVIHSLSITDSKVYAIIDKGAIFTEDNVNWHVLDGGWGFNLSIYFQDERKGFLLSYDYTTCGDCGVAFWIHETTDRGNTWEEVYFNLFDEGNSIQGDFSFSSNHEFGYCIMGKRLVRTPYTGEFSELSACRNYDGIDEIKSENPVVILNPQGNELQVSSLPKLIGNVEIISVTGIKLRQEKGHEKILNINVSDLPKGIYLIRVSYSDKTFYLGKWIKN
jgi:photosystem II stability/assembly factor-like uncharacterized protein